MSYDKIGTAFESIMIQNAKANAPKAREKAKDRKSARKTRKRAVKQQLSKNDMEIAKGWAKTIKYLDEAGFKQGHPLYDNAMKMAQDQ